MTRTTVRLTDELNDEFSEWCDRHGTTKSEVLREHIRDTVGKSNHGPLPDEPELAKGYRCIWQLRSESNRVAVSEAESEVANVTNVPKKAVRRRVFDRLDRRGYINVAVGTITANVDIDTTEPNPDDAIATEAPADD